MPLSTGHRNKMKKWRKESPGNHMGRQLKHMQNGFTAGNGAAAPELLAGLFARAGIKMPRAEAFRDALQRMMREKEAEKETVNETE